MRVLVSGASGMIGSAVCDALRARGNEVIGLSRDPERARATNPTLTWHAWQPTSERPPAEAFEGVAGVVNLIGESIDQRWTPEAKERIHDSRVRTTKNLVDGLVAAEPRPRVLVSQSAAGYYGDQGDALLDVANGPGSDFLARVCVDWEAAAREAEGAGVRVAILRTGPVLEPSGGLLKRLLPPFKLGLGGPLAGGEQYVSWIHIDDEVGLYLWALDNEEVSGALNATAPNPVTNREFSKTLGRVLGRPALLPAPKLAVAAMLGSEGAESVTSSQRAVPRGALDLNFTFRFDRLEPALRDLLAR